jgi:hypothetical protein
MSQASTVACFLPFEKKIALVRRCCLCCMVKEVAAVAAALLVACVGMCSPTPPPQRHSFHPGALRKSLVLNFRNFLPRCWGVSLFADWL